MSFLEFPVYFIDKMTELTDKTAEPGDVCITKLAFFLAMVKYTDYQLKIHADGFYTDFSFFSW